MHSARIGLYPLYPFFAYIDVNFLFTSCPTECRLSSSKSRWQCVVSLRFTSNSQSQVRNEEFGPIIYDKAKVEDRIRRAQRAILNPSKPSKQFLVDTDDNTQDSELSFSSNCVSLQISGPDVADLSFCDLPGGSFMSRLYSWFYHNLRCMSKASLLLSVATEKEKAITILLLSRVWLRVISRSPVASFCWL